MAKKLILLVFILLSSFLSNSFGIEYDMKILLSDGYVHLIGNSNFYKGSTNLRFGPYEEDGKKLLDCFWETREELMVRFECLRENGISFIGDGEIYKKNGYYKGYMVNDTRSGAGIQDWINGERYDGMWKDDNPDGNGTYYYADGSYYSGTFLNGMKNGRGTIYYPDGKVLIGNFVNNKLMNEDRVLLNAKKPIYISILITPVVEFFSSMNLAQRWIFALLGVLFFLPFFITELIKYLKGTAKIKDSAYFIYSFFAALVILYYEFHIFSV